MILFILAFLGGVLTILSPCILPVLPFVFARADRPFLRNGLPMLGGMAVTFAGVAALATVGGGWIIHANSAGRWVAMIVLFAFGLMLLFPSLADRATRPLVALGSRITQRAEGDADQAGGIGTSVLLGAAIGLLWAPCAGPILGLLLTGSALKGASASTAVLLLAYALGAATSLALALMAGKRVFSLMKKSIGAGERVRQILGVLVLLGVVAIAFRLDTGLLTRLSLSGTNRIEQSLLNRAGVVRPQASSTVLPQRGPLPVEGVMPPLNGAVAWLNGPPLTREQLRGKVVVVDFWTYSCINCLRALPHVRAWAQRYKDSGLVVIGVHTPEFAFERDPRAVRRALGDLGVTYPVAVDSDQTIWRAFANQYWPAHYFIDGRGRIRHHHYGEGEYDRSETVIRRLLTENGATTLPPPVGDIQAGGAQASAAMDQLNSPETYVGYARAANFVSNGSSVAPDRSEAYVTPPLGTLNRWGLTGRWTVGREAARLDAAGGRVSFRFHARDLHLVMAPGADGRPVRFRVRLVDGDIGQAHGSDVAADGTGTVTSQRLYQLIRQTGPIRDRTFEIEFLDPGVQVFSFTFG